MHPKQPAAPRPAPAGQCTCALAGKRVDYRAFVPFLRLFLPFLWLLNLLSVRASRLLCTRLSRSRCRQWRYCLSDYSALCRGGKHLWARVGISWQEVFHRKRVGGLSYYLEGILCSESVYVIYVLLCNFPRLIKYVPIMAQGI